MTKKSVLKNKNLAPIDKIVYLQLWDLSKNFQGVCCPSLATIKDSLGISKASTIRSIKKLVKSNVLIKFSRQSDITGATLSNLYVIPELLPAEIAADSENLEDNVYYIFLRKKNCEKSKISRLAPAEIEEKNIARLRRLAEFQGSRLPKDCDVYKKVVEIAKNGGFANGFVRQICQTIISDLAIREITDKQLNIVYKELFRQNSPEKFKNLNYACKTFAAIAKYYYA